MAKKKTSNKQKNSKPVTQENSTPKTKETVKFTPETTVQVTFFEKGIIIKKSNANSKEEIQKMKVSPTVDLEKKRVLMTDRRSGKVYWSPVTGQFPLKYFYQGSKHYNEPKYREVSQKVIWNSYCVQYFTSDEGKPIGYKGNWKKMGKVERLKANIEHTANGRSYEFIIID